MSNRDWSEDEYRECAACASKTGSPTLCPACLHNRALAGRLRDAMEEVNRLRCKLETYADAVVQAVLGRAP